MGSSADAATVYSPHPGEALLDSLWGEPELAVDTPSSYDTPGEVLLERAAGLLASGPLWQAEPDLSDSDCSETSDLGCNLTNSELERLEEEAAREEHSAPSTGMASASFSTACQSVNATAVWAYCSVVPRSLNQPNPPGDQHRSP